MRNRKVKIDKPDSVDLLVIALCRDFDRRKKAIDLGSATRRTLVEFRYLNFKILEAVGDVVEKDLVPIYIEEIGNNVGYAKTVIDGISEVSYKKTKKLLRENIAKKLHLTD